MMIGCLIPVVMGLTLLGPIQAEPIPTEVMTGWMNEAEVGPGRMRENGSQSHRLTQVELELYPIEFERKRPDKSKKRGRKKGKLKGKRGFHKLVAPIEKMIERATRRHESDKKYRKYFTRSHVLSQIYTHLDKNVEGLRALAETLAAKEVVREMVYLAEKVDVSNLSRANNKRSYQVFADIFTELYGLAYRVIRPELGELKVLGPTKLCDGSFLEACLSMSWAIYRRGKNKAKMHLLLDLNLLPDQLVLTPGKGSEREALRQMIKAGVSYIIDRGYNSYQLFADIAEMGAYFITRLLKNAGYEVIISLPVSAQDARRGILADQLIYLGEGDTRVEPVFRRVVYQAPDGKIYQYLTNRLDLSPWIICQAYKYRWQIELFFRWIKNHLQVKHFLSRSENAVKIQLYAALVTYLLVALFAAKELGAVKLRVRHLRQIKNMLDSLISEAEIVRYLADLAAMARTDVQQSQL